MIHGKKFAFKWVLAIAWVVLAAAALTSLLKIGIPLSKIPEALQAFIQKQGPFGPFLYVILYILRPLILFPATLLTAASGLIWGPFLGFIYTLIGENLSAAFAFWIGRYFGRDLMAGTKVKFFAGLDSHIRKHGFMTVLILRLAMMPFDAVNFGCGLTAVRFRDYAAGTAIGILPGVLSFVYVGSSWFEPENLAVGAVLLLISFSIAAFARRTGTGREIIGSNKVKKKR